MERRNKLLALSLVILIGLTSAAFYFTNRDTGPVADPSLFRVDGLETVDSVEIESPRGKVTLRYDGSKWVVNKGHRADAQMIEVFFATLAQVVPKRPVSGNLRDSVAGMVRKEGARVALFAGEELKKEFFVGGNPQKSEAYFLSSVEGPFVMTIPGYRVYVAGVFELDENGWRDKQVFRFNQRNFDKLTSTSFRDPADNFVITYEDRVFEIPGIQAPDTTKIFDYLDGVALLKAEELYSVGQKPWVDSLLNVTPSFTIEVADTQGRTSTLVIYPPLAARSQVAGRMGEQAALFQKKDIIRIARKKSYFKKNQ